MNPGDESFHEWINEQLERLPDFRSRRMFGGSGLYSGGRFFGLVYQSRLYFRTSDDTRAAYTAAGMEHFQPNPKQSLKNYYEVPANVLEDHDALTRWAMAAIQVSTVYYTGR